MLGLLEELGLEYEEQVTAATVHASFAVQETDAYLDAVLADQRAAARAAVGPFLCPRSIALVGASDKPASIGALLLANLLASGFTGPVYPVNPPPPGHPGGGRLPGPDVLSPAAGPGGDGGARAAGGRGRRLHRPAGGPGGVRDLGRVRRGRRRGPGPAG